MRSDIMTVFYHDAANGATGKGIYRIDADGNVIFTTPTETAKGDKGIYNVDADTIDLMGNVLLTRGPNVLKGTKVVYNLATGRSVLTSGAEGTISSTGRVRGLFMPNNSGSSQ
jgi:lipopolysaccharide export system protein LptA